MDPLAGLFAATVGNTAGGMTTYLIGRLHRWGWVRVNWLAALAFMAAGRLSRYIVVAAFA